MRVKLLLNPIQLRTAQLILIMSILGYNIAMATTPDRTDSDTVPVAKDLEELVVKGEEYSMVDGKLTIAPPEGAVKSSLFATDLLAKLGIPGLRYDFSSSSVTVDGQNPVILLNGVISNINRLNTIKASDVLSVQFSREVPLIFRNYGNCVIDVRIRQISEGGTISVRAEVDLTGAMQDGSAAASYNRGASQWFLNYAISHRNNYKVYDTYVTRFNAPEMTVEMTSATSSPFKYTTQYPAISYLYNPSEKLVFQANLLLNTYSSHRNTDGSGYDSMLGDYYLSTNSHDQTLSPTLDLYLQKTFGTHNMLQANVKGNIANSDYRIISDYDYAMHPNLMIYDNSTSSRRRSMLTTIAYTYNPTNSLTLEASYENLLAHTVNRYDTREDKYVTREINNYIYAQVAKSFGKFRVSVTSGVKFDYLKKNAHTEKYVNNQSLLRLNYNITPKISMMVLAKYEPMSLPLNLLIQQDQKISPYLVTTGNPDLKKPQYWNLRWNMSIHTGKFTIIPRIGYLRKHNPILMTYGYDASANAFISIPRNMRFTDQLGGNLQLVANEIANMFNFSGTIMWSRNTTNDGADYVFSKNTVDASLDVSWYYGRWAISLHHDIPGKWFSGYAIIKDDAYSHLMVTWRPSSHWSIFATWMYMFQRRGWTHDYSLDAPHYFTSTSRSIRNNANGVEIGFTYNCDFGNIFSWKGRQRTLHNSDTQTAITKYE